MHLVYKQGPHSITESRTVGYIVTLTPLRNGMYRVRWDYPKDPEHPSVSLSQYSKQAVQDRVDQGKWVPYWPYPQHVLLPEGL